MGLISRFHASTKMGDSPFTVVERYSFSVLHFLQISFFFSSVVPRVGRIIIVERSLNVLPFGITLKDSRKRACLKSWSIVFVVILLIMLLLKYKDELFELS